MKKLIGLLVLIPCLAQAQDITGKWNGMLRAQGMELRLIFQIALHDSTYEAKMDSPDQNTFGIPASATTFTNATLTVELAKIGARYQGKLGPADIDGTFYQVSQSFPLNLTKNRIEKKALFRPQEPKKPYPYASEDVKFFSDRGKIELAGTLTVPAGNEKFPVAILISGSGPQNRDEEFMTHKPFLVLADYLTQKGIAVLRYDDRGFGQSTDKHGSATSADFAKDVSAAIDYLKTRTEIDQTRIGLIGHSEGGLIAPLVDTDTKLAFMVLLAAPGLLGSQILLKQIELTGRVQGVHEEHLQRDMRFARGVYDLFSQFGKEASIDTRLTAYLNERLVDTTLLPQGLTKEEFIRRQVTQFRRPWVRYFLTYDPVHSLKRIQCPILVLNGGKDVQVGPENLLVIEKAIREGGNTNVTVNEFRDMNHLFQTCKTGAMDKHATIDQTVDPVVLEEITGWVLTQTT